VSRALVIKNLHLTIDNNKDAVPILRGINLDLQAGEIHGLVGESGAGKSMLGRVILEILPPRARITEGSIDYPTRRPLSGKTKGRSAARHRPHISLIPQDPMTSLNPVKKIGKQMSEILRLYQTGRARSMLDQAEGLLHEVKIKNPARVLQQYPHQLSGGMRQRALIAMAFSTKPQIIIADEPTTALDVSVQRQVLRLIQDLQKQHGTTILFITHDLGVVAKICNRISLMHSGMILEHGNVAEVFCTPSHAYTRSLLAAIPRYDRPLRELTPVAESLQLQLHREARAYDHQRRN
jgi:peptide/nickel transport system ATP-binding protein